MGIRTVFSILLLRKYVLQNTAHEVEGTHGKDHH